MSPEAEPGPDTEPADPGHLMTLDAAIADLLASELGITGPCLSRECDCP